MVGLDELKCLFTTKQFYDWFYDSVFQESGWQPPSSDCLWMKSFSSWFLMMKLIIKLFFDLDFENSEHFFHQFSAWKLQFKKKITLSSNFQPATIVINEGNRGRRNINFSSIDWTLINCIDNTVYLQYKWKFPRVRHKVFSIRIKCYCSNALSIYWKHFLASQI